MVVMMKGRRSERERVRNVSEHQIVRGATDVLILNDGGMGELQIAKS